MLQLTRLSGSVVALNPDLIERAEATPYTVVTLVNGAKYVVRESIDELTELIRRYRADVIAAAHDPAAPHSADRGKGSGPRATVVALRPGEG